ncbi:AraC family transcriptional regulator [Salinisphaera sp. Q1T1-3]|uniref:helix-turn-helix domain-containing protein n=1 Tax=Salinisphaera sp. Q1T1-3 TaxID=2321229 RepID=UPI000E7654DF|nr:AraC family transcriptional regulator [Salinisphaera sp. Q1T1-3]RJS93372.1 AraC family transcriptional regulator [Salinisphaera sp. Q1T1-3]
MRMTAPRSNAGHAPLGDPIFERVGQDPRHSFYWHMHGYPDAIARWNYHPEYELHLVQYSSGHYVVGDFAGRFGPGNLVLTGPNLPHVWFSDLAHADERIAERDVVLQFSGDWLRRLAAVCPELARVEDLLTGADRGLVFEGPTATEVARRLREMGDLAPMARLASLMTLLDLLAGTPARPLASPTYRLEHSAVRSEQVDAILRYLHGHFDRPLSMSRLAHWQDMTPSAFSRFFKRATGDTFVAFVRRMRIDRACALLVESEDTVADICFRVGYRNLSNFNRHFRALTGHTPTRYRTLFAAGHAVA